jgi:hypothetical protein
MGGWVGGWVGGVRWGGVGGEPPRNGRGWGHCSPAHTQRGRGRGPDTRLGARLSPARSKGASPPVLAVDRPAHLQRAQAQLLRRVEQRRHQVQPKAGGLPAKGLRLQEDQHPAEGGFCLALRSSGSKVWGCGSLRSIREVRETNSSLQARDTAETGGPDGSVCSARGAPAHRCTHPSCQPGPTCQR